MKTLLFKLNKKSHVLLFLFFSNFCSAESLPTLFSSDKAWIQRSFSAAATAMELVEDPNSIDQITEELSPVLFSRMFPYLHNKNAMAEALTVKLSNTKKDSKEYKKISYVISVYQEQMAYLTKEIKSYGLSKLWSSKLSDSENIKKIGKKLSYVLDTNNQNFIAINSEGIATYSSTIPKDIMDRIKLCIQERVNKKHKGSVEDYYDWARGKFRKISTAVRFIGSESDPKIKF